MISTIMILILLISETPAEAQTLWEAFLAKCEISDGLDLIDDDSFQEFCDNSHEITDPFLIELLDGV